jgi:hypothetical protein
MTTKEITRLVSLVTYANVSLQNIELDFDFEHSIIEYCYGSKFILQPPDGIAGASQVIASNANDWFTYLKKNEAKRVRLHYKTSNQFGIPDHITVAFIGGGSYWYIEVVYGEKSDLYSGGQRGESEPWKTYFILLKRDLENIEDSSTSVREARVRLSDVLENLIAFSSRFEYTIHWAENFKRSKQTLTDYQPIESDDFIPHGVYSLEARQLMETALQSWVFGGMGSWNDLAFSDDDQKQYAELSKELYEAICNAIVSIANSYP